MNDRHRFIPSTPVALHPGGDEAPPYRRLDMRHQTGIDPSAGLERVQNHIRRDRRTPQELIAAMHSAISPTPFDPTGVVGPDLPHLGRVAQRQPPRLDLLPILLDPLEGLDVVPDPHVAFRAGVG